jgi:autotransporter-associated beta strand protein
LPGETNNGAQYLGFGVFEKTGSSTWTLENSTGAVTPWTIMDGTLAVSTDGALGDPSGALSFAGSGGILQFLSGFSTGRGIVLTAAGTFDTNGQNATLAGLISGGGELIKIGSGTLTLSDTNTYTGGTSVNGGELAVSGDANLGDPSGALSFAGSGGILQFLSGFSTERGIVLNAAGTFDTNGQNATLAGLISGGGELVKIGLGTLTLDHANAYSGGTLLGGGILDLAVIGAAGASSITFGAGGGETLQIENAALSVVTPSHNNFGNTVQSFGANDIVDLTGLAFSTHATASYNAKTDVLKVTSHGITDTFTMTTTATHPVSGNFQLSEDGHGGTEIMLVGISHHPVV